MPTVNLNQITLDVTDMERSIAFYQKLGLVLIVYTHPRYARLECPDGGTTLSLHPGLFALSTVSLYFEVPDVKTRHEELCAAGIEFDTTPADQSWGWTEAWFRDPDGHRLCLYHAGENRRFPPWRGQIDGGKANDA